MDGLPLILTLYDEVRLNQHVGGEMILLHQTATERIPSHAARPISRIRSSYSVQCVVAHDAAGVLLNSCWGSNEKLYPLCNIRVYFALHRKGRKLNVN